MDTQQPQDWMNGRSNGCPESGIFRLRENRGSCSLRQAPAPAVIPLLLVPPHKRRSSHTMRVHTVAIAAVLALLALSGGVHAATTTLQLLGQLSLPLNASSGAPATEQVAFDDQEKVAYLIGNQTLYVVDLSPSALLDSGSRPSPTPKALSVLTTLDLSTTLTDVIFCATAGGNGYLAVAANGETKVEAGSVTIYSRYLRQQPAAVDSPPSLQELARFSVGALPDQAEFSRDCRTILVANEGEPLTYEEAPGSLKNDPEGSVSVISLCACNPEAATTGSDDRSSDLPACTFGCGQVPSLSGSVATATFSAWNDKRSQLTAQGVKLSGIGASVAQDLEPECVTFSEDERLAFVSLQENNAVAVLDVASATILTVQGLGFKDHSKPYNALDTSDADGGVNIVPRPVFGLYQPDEMRSFRHEGVDYLVTANEGDARDWPGLLEEVPFANISSRLNPAVFPDAKDLTSNTSLGNLVTLEVNGQPYAPFSDPSNGGSFDKIFIFGGRSFAIWRIDTPPADGAGGSPAPALSLVYDSGSQLEQVAARELADVFNSEGRSDTLDQTSPDKGPEPEGLTIGPCGGGTPASSASSNSSTGSSGAGRRCLFLGAESSGVVYVYDISDPTRPVFQSVARPPQPDAADEGTRLTAPEGLTYASYTADDFTVHRIVLVAYEADDEDASVPAGLGVFRIVEQ